jgi:glucose-1-phosphate adenylyltransferase
MADRVLGVVVAGGRRASLDPLVPPADASLTPFAGKFRFIDFALGTLANSGVRDVYVVGRDGSGPLARTLEARSDGARPRLVPVPGPPAPPASRAARLAEALHTAAPLVELHGADTLVVLFADHILQTDLRPLAAAHGAMKADVTLAALPIARGEASSTTLLRLGEGRRVRGVEPTVPACGLVALGWAGDLVLRADALPALLDALPAGGEPDADAVAALADACALHAYEVLESRLPGAADGRGGYWHEPVTLEAYYDAQMNLCTPRPFLDLYNPAWPLPALVTGLAPAKVVADQAGRAGQALNALVSDGSVIRGGMVVNAVIGHGVVVESGAEVEDSVLLDGCRIGRGAHVRRALVGPGAVIADGEEVGYGAVPSAPGRLAPSGLSIVVASS